MRSGGSSQRRDPTHPPLAKNARNGAPPGFVSSVKIRATRPPIYIGKESDRHWEDGEDLSLLEFQAIQYRRKGNAVADDEQLPRIANVPKREFMRRGINQHTLENISKRKPVRATKLAKCLRVLEEYESQHETEE